MSFDDRRAQLKTIVEQLDQADGRSQSLRIEAGRHLYALRMQWPDGVYGPSIRMLGIKHLKKAAAYIAEYCAAFGKPLPPAMQARKDAKEQNTTQSDDTAKVSNVRNENGLSDAGAFYVPDATPEQEAAFRALEGYEDGDDFEGELGSDLDPEEESDEGEGTQHTAQSTDEPATPVIMEPGVLKMRGDSLELVQLPKPIKLPPVTGEQMRLDDLYLAAETCQGRIREIKAALSTQLDGPQREAVERAFAAVEQAHAMLVIGGGR